MEEVTGGRLVGKSSTPGWVEGGDKRTLGEGLWRIKEEEEYKGKKGVMRICEYVSYEGYGGITSVVSVSPQSWAPRPSRVCETERSQEKDPFSRNFPLHTYPLSRLGNLRRTGFFE